MRIVLVDIPPVPRHEAVEGSHESPLASVVREIEAFQIVQEHMARHILNACDLSTLIHTLNRPKNFSCSVSHYLPPAGSPSSANSNVVVALNPEAEEALTSDHIVVGFLVVIEAFGVVNVVADIATAAPNDGVNHIRANNHPDHSTNI